MKAILPYLYFGVSWIFLKRFSSLKSGHKKSEKHHFPKDFGHPCSSLLPNSRWERKKASPVGYQVVADDSLGNHSNPGWFIRISKLKSFE